MPRENGHVSCSGAEPARFFEASNRDFASLGEESAAVTRWQAPWYAGRAWGAALCAAYPLLIVTPLLLFAAASPAADHSRTVEVGVDCAVVAFTIIVMQFVLSARLPWIEAPFGLDVIIRFHQAMAFVAVCLAGVHPLLVASGEGWAILIRWSATSPVWAGRMAILILLASIVIAVGRRKLQLKYETWLAMHNAAAFLLLGLAFVHGLALGDDFAHPLSRRIWVVLPLLASSAWFYSHVARPWLLARCPYRVVSVTPETPAVWTLMLARLRGQPLKFFPGQFQFLRPLSGACAGEEHPFSIASSPSPDGRIRLTIRACGDFTSTICRLQPGDLVAVHGPFGRFSHVFHPDSQDLVFIAGGVGITPLMSMLRSMRDRRESCSILLIYASRDEAAIVFRQELEAIEARSTPRLKTVHILSRPPADWEGRSGRLDLETLRTICSGFAGKAFFICCPPEMAKMLIRGLRRAGVGRERIHADYFGF